MKKVIQNNTKATENTMTTTKRRSASLVQRETENERIRKEEKEDKGALKAKDVVTLISEDMVKISINESVAKRIGILENFLQTFQLFGSGEVVEPIEFPLALLSSDVILKIIDWLKEHAEDGDDGNDDANTNHKDDEEEEALFGQEYLNEDYLINLNPWDRNYFEKMDTEMLVSVTKGANFMNIPVLLDQCCRQLAKIMSGMKADELRRKFNLPNDLTKEEMDKIGEEFAFINDNN